MRLVLWRCSEFLERVTGIEPVSSAWKAEVLPLHNTRAACDIVQPQGQVHAANAHKAAKSRHIHAEF